jgi:hypothetical protein
MCYVYANLAIAFAKEKFRCYIFIYLALKHTKSELTKAISKSITKNGYLGLEIDMRSTRQTILGTVTRKPPKELFLIMRQKCYKKKSRIKQFPFKSTILIKKG